MLENAVRNIEAEITNLQNQTPADQISDLKNQLEAKNVEIATLNSNLEKLTEAFAKALERIETLEKKLENPQNSSLPGVPQAQQNAAQYMPVLPQPPQGNLPLAGLANVPAPPPAAAPGQ